MIGLEYILQLEGMQKKDLAEKLGINKQNITLWIKGKQNISQKYLPILSNIFGLEQSYFQEELTETDKLAIQNNLLFLKIKGSFACEPIDDEEDEMVDGHPIIRVTPKNFDTDPRFAKMYRNQLEIELLQNLESIKDRFISISQINMADEVKLNQILKIYCNVIDELDSMMFNTFLNKDEDCAKLIEALNQYKKTFG
ncbi:MAG: helix-turn-helix domain-containing protein [Oscillospiraceae bacterium]|jgi:transcriptional regulator with XRE-family HTH domain|nr:helix-turn-helix domain-containing protein [Oscillospiraceae bacterium]